MSIVIDLIVSVRIVKVVLKRRQVKILKSIERVLNQNRHHELIYSKVQNAFLTRWLIFVWL